jgi:hypothetical protein
MMERSGFTSGSGSVPLTDLDPEGPKIYVAYGSGSGTLDKRVREIPRGQSKKVAESLFLNCFVAGNARMTSGRNDCDSTRRPPASRPSSPLRSLFKH